MFIETKHTNGNNIMKIIALNELTNTNPQIVEQMKECGFTFVNAVEQIGENGAYALVTLKDAYGLKYTVEVKSGDTYFDADCCLYVG